MKIAFIGSREFKDMPFAKLKIEEILLDAKPSLVISGGAKGIDSLAIEVAKELGYNTKVFEAEWDKYGKSAGFKRNQLIIDEADYVVALWDGVSKGTKHSIDLAIKQRKPIDIYIRS